jgi:hypothetical protein
MKMNRIVLGGTVYGIIPCEQCCMKCDLNDYCDKGNILGDFCCRTFGESMYFVRKDMEEK